ncbi:MAG: metalloregulator ArsR/SmtB family transcription factor [Bacillota bacterium]|nr:metalloregulator ArsR/SmtB family transcription factor [Bacillota bacterium]
MKAVRTPSSTVATVFRALGDDTRLQMLSLLQQREICVCEFVDLFGISQPAISEHLRRLKEAGLVAAERRGIWVFYRLRRPLPAYASEALRAVRLPQAVQKRFASMTPVNSCRTGRQGPASENLGVRQVGLPAPAPREPAADGFRDG